MLAHFDLVFCMDASAAMESELRRVTRMVMRLLDDLIERAGNVGHEVHCLRARLVVFRSCGTEPIQESRFFTMPQEASEFARHLTSVQAAGGEPVHPAAWRRWPVRSAQTGSISRGRSTGSVSCCLLRRPRSRWRVRMRNMPARTACRGILKR